MSNPTIKVIKVPFSLGGRHPGAELGPDAVIQAGLLRQLGQLGLTLEETIEIDCPSASLRSEDNWTRGGPPKHLQQVKEMSARLGEAVSDAISRDVLPLVVGGDHSGAIGTLAGLTKHYKRPGVIWFDAHADLNSEASSMSGNMHGMPLGIATGQAKLRLSDILSGAAELDTRNLVIIGARELDPAEREIIKSKGIACYTMHEVDRQGIQTIVEEALKIAGDGTDGIHVSFDLDVLDPLEAAGVGTPVPGGLNYREAHFACELLAESHKVTSVEIVEVNAQLDHDRRTARLAVELVASLFGKRIL
ncbi:arginase [Paenibacillus sp. 598K]|uniref:arginase n=1 Tax=Paenibacillus sp. 598K TaxID=1117987 RepID=UPI000FFA5823|nr:arginase [Paenibacillus sp. 598K]GBF74296.1 arginase [Paenibacillus sp. 598K]